MKVALIDPSLFTWPYDRALAEGLARKGHEVAVFGPHGGETDGATSHPLFVPHYYALSQGRHGAHLPAKLRRIAKGLEHPRSNRSLAKRLRAWRPDAIHFQWCPLPLLDLSLLRSLRDVAPLILTVHDTVPFNGSPRARIQTMAMDAVLKQFDWLIVHTDQGRRRMADRLNRGDRISTVPHGLLHPAESGPPPEARPDEKLTLLAFGKIKPYKGLDVLIDALALMPISARELCRVEIVGRPYMDVQPLVAAVRDKGLAGMVSFDFNFVPDEELARRVDRSSALLFPYREIEASGVLMTAIGRNKTMIASRLGAFAEYLTDGADAMLVRPADPAELAMALERFASDTQLRARLSGGITRLNQSFPAWDEIAARTVDLYVQAATAQAGGQLREPAHGDATRTAPEPGSSSSG